MVGIGARHGAGVSDEVMARFAGYAGDRHRWRRYGRARAASRAVAALGVVRGSLGGIVVMAGMVMLHGRLVVLHPVRGRRVRAAERRRRGVALEGHRQQCQPDDQDAQEGFHTAILARWLGC